MNRAEQAGTVGTWVSSTRGSREYPAKVPDILYTSRYYVTMTPAAYVVEPERPQIRGNERHVRKTETQQLACLLTLPLNALELSVQARFTK